MPERLKSGDIVERYKVESVLGDGGFAVVYRVCHTTLGTIHALKVLELDHPDLRKRLLLEGRLQANLRHPNLLPVSDVLDVRGAPGLLMPFITGGTLADLIGNTGLALPDVERLFHSIVDGVSYAHAQGMAHRDLKPENILLDANGQVLVADFGIARCLYGQGDQRHTRIGVAMGTPAYMPPEQMRDARIADHRADIYALGVILYEMISGQTPFIIENDIVANVATIEAGDYPPLSLGTGQSAQGMMLVIRSCLAPRPNDRPQSCEEVLALLSLDTTVSQDDTDKRTWRAHPQQSGSGASHIAAKIDALTASTLDESLPPVKWQMDSIEETQTPAKKKSRLWKYWRPMALLLPVLVAITDLGAHLDPLLQYPMLRWAHGVLPVESTVVVAIEPQADLRELRPRHPAVLRGLAEAGATVIYWDVSMSARSADDAAIVEAVNEIGRAGVAVVMPVRFHNGVAKPPGTKELAAAVTPGLVELQRDLTLGWVRRAPLRHRPVDGPPIYHSAVESLRAHLHAVALPKIKSGELVVGGTRNAIWAEQLYLHPVGDIPRVAYGDPSSWSAVHGKVAVVGVYGGLEDLLRTPEGSRYGVEVSAGLVETLVQQASLTVASPEINALLALLTTLGTALLGGVLRRRAKLVALFVPLAAFGLAVVMASVGTLLALLPLFIAGGVGLFLGKEREG